MAKSSEFGALNNLKLNNNMKTIYLQDSNYNWQQFEYNGDSPLEELKEELEKRKITIGHYVTIGDSATIGHYVTIGHDVTIRHDVTIGNYATIGHYVTIGHDVTI